MNQPFILASASPRRRELLRSIGIAFDVVMSGVDEGFLDGETPEEHVVRLSREKSQTVARDNPNAWVLGADTIVLLDDEVLGKPYSEQEGREMLRKLSGREHRVITGFTIFNERLDIMMSESVGSTVLFKEIPDDEIDWYVSKREPYDKAGGYAVQGMAAFFIKEIHGSYTNVVGLPLAEVVAALKKVGIVSFKGGNEECRQ